MHDSVELLPIRSFRVWEARAILVYRNCHCLAHNFSYCVDVTYVSSPSLSFIHLGLSIRGELLRNRIKKDFSLIEARTYASNWHLKPINPLIPYFQCFRARLMARVFRSKDQSNILTAELAIAQLANLGLAI